MAYVKTNWVDDSTPAINASNLNKIEEGIAESNGVILFDGVINEFGTYTLNDNTDNYNYIEIFVGRGTDYGGNSVKVRRGQKSANTMLMYGTGSRAYIHILDFSWNGTEFTYNSITNIDLKNNNLPEVTNQYTPENTLQDVVYKIVGWKTN